MYFIGSLRFVSGIEQNVDVFDKLRDESVRKENDTCTVGSFAILALTGNMRHGRNMGGTNKINRPTLQISLSELPTISTDLACLTITSRKAKPRLLPRMIPLEFKERQVRQTPRGFPDFPRSTTEKTWTSKKQRCENNAFHTEVDRLKPFQGPHPFTYNDFHS